ncbi:MAG: BON domain-containing protein [Pseudomonadota bacterium]|jgi:hypothetical protein
MKRRRTSEGKQSNAVERLGIGGDIPVPDFSDQPDSGGRIGGTRGVDEFGIEGGAAAEWGRDALHEASLESTDIDRVQAGVDQASEYEEEVESEEESAVIARVLEEDVQDDSLREILPNDLQSLIEYRLRHHDRIDAHNVSVLMVSPGLVVLRGRVRSQSESMRISEVVSALPGVHAVRNLLLVPR